MPFLFFLLDPEHHCPSELLGTEVWRLLWPQLSNTEHPSINGKQQDLSALPFRRGSLRATFSTAICSLSPLWTMSLFFSSQQLSLFIQSPPTSFSSLLISPLSHPCPSSHYESSVPLGDTSTPRAVCNYCGVLTFY